MPTFHNPRFVHVETGSGGGGLVAAGIAVVAAGAGVVWLVRELLKMWVEIAIIAGGTTVIVGTFVVWMAIKYNRGSLPLNQEALAEIRAERARAALPAGAVHYHTHYEEHRHQHQHDDKHVHVHTHAEQPGAVERPAVEARKVVPGVVLGETAPNAIEARKAPLYRINPSEQPVTREKK
jgi:hypothetical protein